MAEYTEQNYDVPGIKRLTTLKHLPFRLGIFITLLGLLIASDVRGDQIDWPTVSFTQVATNIFNSPTAIAQAGDGSQRLFVCERPGSIRIIQNSNVLVQPFLDITDRTLSANIEQGLLGLAFPPGYSTNAHFYVDYIRKPDGAVVVSRFQLTADPNVADTNSEQVVLVVPKPFNNHNGGQIAFGPDGYLYIGVGDGGSENDPQLNGQKTSTLLGKLLRINVEGGVATYSVPTNNPFVGNTNYAPEIWALGLRNPWRFSFDRLTGDLFIADVGQTKYEEVDIQPASSTGGENYGWKIMEGPSNNVAPVGFTNYASLTKPVMSYDHFSLPAGLQGSITGGYVYRGPNEPRMNGAYFFADFVAGWMWASKSDGTNWQKLTVMNPDGPASTNMWISSFGEDEQGRLYIAVYNQGKIYQVVDAQRVWTPTFTPTNGFIYSNSVIVTCATTNATICYTTNGIDPTLSDPVVPSNGVLPVNNGATNKIKAFRADLSPSGVATAIFTYRVGTPFFSPPQGPITNPTPVSIATVTPGATIYFTTNGTAPTTSSPIYSGPLTLKGPVTVRALGVAAGFSNSIVATASYTAAQVALPDFLPVSGPITNGTTITISNATPGATIYYTTDGSTPTTNSPVYTAPFVIMGGTTVSAFGVANGYINSAVRTVVYSLVTTATPAFAPPTSPLAYSTSISVSCATPGATIYYTLDGTPPTTNSAIYSGPLVITNDFTLSAFAVSLEHLDSSVLTVPYTLIKAAKPIFSPAQGPLTIGTLISISCSTPNSVIRYTVDGSEPNESAPIFTAPLPYTIPITLKARAYAPQFDPSDVLSTFLGLKDVRPTVVTTVAGSTTSGYSNAVGALARFSKPQGICRDSLGNLYLVDTDNHSIRRISATGIVETFAGTGAGGSAMAWATNSQFLYPTGICLDQNGNVYVADSENCNRICKIQTNGLVTVFANLTSCNYATALWQMEQGPDGNLYLGYWFGLRKITADGSAYLIAGTGCNCPGGWGREIGAGVDSATNVYSAAGAFLWKTDANGTTDFVAGGIPDYSDGPRTLSGFYNLRDVAVDASTNLFLSDATRVRKLGTDGWVSTLAGTGVPGYRNGRGSIAQFNNAAGLCIDTNGNVYVADSGNNCIRKISPDTANIGIADDWQKARFGTVGIDPNADPDNDGLSNFAEFWAGTDPLNSNSSLAIEVTPAVPPNQLKVQWQSVAGKTYTVQYSTNLIAWNNLGNPVSGNGNALSVFDNNPIGPTGRRFYRLVLTDF